MRWVVTDNIHQETWRRLLEFANVDLTVDEIVRRKGKPNSSSETQNYKKQAQQARVCVLQAKEYFEAAKSSSLITAPNHLYYGIVAISSLMMLVMGNGKQSLDYLRRDKRNANHGLLFSTECTAGNAKSGLSLIESSWSMVRRNGHFINWYSTLPKTVEIYVVQEKRFRGGGNKSLVAIGRQNVVGVEAIVGRKKTAVELLSVFPDLCYDLRRYGVSQDGARTSHHVKIGESGEVKHEWLLHEGFYSESQDKFLEGFKTNSGGADGFNWDVSNTGLVWSVDFRYKEGDSVFFSWPDSRETMYHDFISYAGNLDTHEIVDAFMVSFQLSMLSRYFPDLWVACLESHCKAAKLVEQAVELLIKKVPIMALSLLSIGGLTISTHREPWK